MSTSETSLLTEQITVVNIGLELFAAAMRQQGLEVAQVDWRPPAGGDPELQDILEQLL